MTLTEDIWTKFQSRLKGFIRSRVNDEQLAEDLLQDVFVKIHLKQNALKDKERLEAWLYQITRNTIIDYFRKEKSSALKEFEQILPEESNLNEEYLPCMHPFIDKLPDIYQDVLRKTVFGSVSQKEYAQLHGLSYSTVKSRVQRGRQRLKQLFLECCKLKFDSYGNIYDNESGKCGCL
ncbi:MAG: RNA polymerase sigma factor SigZ [Bacteroidia bacterium]|nr:RNA polymerase sigma factor SigZ [Bacteroidia bacterium]